MSKILLYIGANPLASHWLKLANPINFIKNFIHTFFIIKYDINNFGGNLSTPRILSEIAHIVVDGKKPPMCKIVIFEKRQRTCL